MSAIKWFIPKPFWRKRPEYRKHPQLTSDRPPQPCRGAARAMRRHSLPKLAPPWMAANEQARPHRERKQKANIEAMQAAALMAKARIALVMRMFGGGRAA